MLTKTCSGCGRDLPVGNFSRNRQKKDGLNYCCKDCSRAYSKNHYNNNKTYYIKKANKSKRNRRDWWNEIKSQLKCEVCGQDHPATLDFHHRNPDEKEFELSDATRMPKELVLKEIKKCEVLCSNCHRIRHWNELANEMGSHWVDATKLLP